MMKLAQNCWEFDAGDAVPQWMIRTKGVTYTFTCTVHVWRSIEGDYTYRPADGCLTPADGRTWVRRVSHGFPTAAAAGHPDPRVLQPLAWRVKWRLFDLLGITRLGRERRAATERLIAGNGSIAFITAPNRYREYCRICERENALCREAGVVGVAAQERFLSDSRRAATRRPAGARSS